MTKWILIAGGILSGMAVLVGAFGAHSLKGLLDAKAMGWVETGVTYQTTHGLALLACGLLPPSNAVSRTGYLFIAGTVVFSSSLYVMALTGYTKLGIVTPIGGLLLIAAWLSFCLAVWKAKF